MPNINPANFDAAKGLIQDLQAIEERARQLAMSKTINCVRQ
jgi:hypothetical protein